MVAREGRPGQGSFSIDFPAVPDYASPMEDKHIYTITAVAVSDKPNPIFARAGGMYPEAREFHTTPMGFAFEREKAMELAGVAHEVFAGTGPTPEISYDYMVVGEYGQGVLLVPVSETWYRDDGEKWVPCDKPSGVAHIAGFAGI